MPTKARKEREALRKAEETALDDFFANKPSYLNGLVVDNADLISDGPEYRLKGGLVSSDAYGNFVLESAVIASRSNAANRDREKIAANDRTNLQRKYSEIWFMRGAAKRIAIEETESGNRLSERAVQNYIAHSKKRMASKVP